MKASSQLALVLNVVVCTFWFEREREREREREPVGTWDGI